MTTKKFRQQKSFRERKKARVLKPDRKDRPRRSWGEIRLRKGGGGTKKKMRRDDYLLSSGSCWREKIFLAELRGFGQDVFLWRQAAKRTQP